MPAGLSTSGTITPTVVPTVTFGPTLGIAAGRVAKLGLDIRSFREPLLRSIREVMVPSIRRNFDEGGRPAWEPLADDTVERRDGESEPILVRSGSLRRVASQINIWDITTTSAVIRDLPQAVWYGKVHQAGYEGNSMAALVKKHSGDVVAASAAHTAKITAAISSGTQLAQGAVSIPARPFLVFQDEDDAAINAVFDAWLEERITLAGFKRGL